MNAIMQKQGYPDFRIPQAYSKVLTNLVDGRNQSVVVSRK